MRPRPERPAIRAAPRPVSAIPRAEAARPSHRRGDGAGRALRRPDAGAVRGAARGAGARPAGRGAPGRRGPVLEGRGARPGEQRPVRGRGRRDLFRREAHHPDRGSARGARRFRLRRPRGDSGPGPGREAPRRHRPPGGVLPPDAGEAAVARRRDPLRRPRRGAPAGRRRGARRAAGRGGGDRLALRGPGDRALRAGHGPAAARAGRPHGPEGVRRGIPGGAPAGADRPAPVRAVPPGSTFPPRTTASRRGPPAAARSIPSACAPAARW